MSDKDESDPPDRSDRDERMPQSEVGDQHAEHRSDENADSHTAGSDRESGDRPSHHRSGASENDHSHEGNERVTRPHDDHPDEDTLSMGTDPDHESAPADSFESIAADPDEIDPEELTVPVRSLHPRVRILWVLRAAISATFAGIIVALIDRFVLGFGPELPVAIAGGLLVIGVVHALLHYRIWKYEVREDALYLERGVLTRVRTVVPFVRIQHVDTSRSPVERLVGLSTSVVYTAGSRGADVSIPGLEEDRAEDLQARLKQLAIAAEGDDAV